MVRVHGPANDRAWPAVSDRDPLFDPDSPITKGLSDWTTIKEELYNNIAGELLDTAHALARGKQTVKDKKSRHNGATA